MNYCPFKKFKNLLGEPNKGVHKYKILNTSMVDYFLTLILAFTISYFTTFPLVLSTIFSFILDHGYVCPICKDRGYIACSYCIKGCIFCNYSGVIKCKCQPDLMMPIFNE